MKGETDYKPTLAKDGFCVIPSVLDSNKVSELLSALKPMQHNKASAGIRALAQKLPQIHALVESSTIRSILEPILGTKAHMVRSVLFTKDQETNWQVAWHQDLSIAVTDKADIEGYSRWSIKEGLVHVQPPIHILENMLTLRLHLDAADEHNGALWISPGTHRLGRIVANEAATLAAKYGKTLCKVNAGDALLFRPLVLHASRKSTNNQPRRVVHLEFAGIELPPPLQWNEAA